MRCLHRDIRLDGYDGHVPMMRFCRSCYSPLSVRFPLVTIDEDRELETGRKREMILLDDGSCADMSVVASKVFLDVEDHSHLDIRYTAGRFVENQLCSREL